jgi:hypothetical protein
MTKQTGKHESESRDITPEDERNSLRALGLDPDEVIRRALHDELRLWRFLAGVPVSQMMRSEPLADPAVLDGRLAKALEALGPFAPTLRARLENRRMDTAKPKKPTEIGRAARAYFARCSSDDAAIDAMIVFMRSADPDTEFGKAYQKNESIESALRLTRDGLNHRLRDLRAKGKVPPMKAGRPKK